MVLLSVSLVIPVVGDASAFRVAPKLPEGGKAVNGLKLTLTAEKPETTMLKDGKDATPLKLKLTFTNVSDKPIKLDAYDIYWNHLKGEVKAPDDKSLSIARLAVARRPVPAKAEDFIEIAAGKTYVVTQELTFPGSLPEGAGVAATCSVLKPGDFKITLKYSNAKEFDSPFAKGSWTGDLTSNELTIKVKPANGK